MTPSRAVTWCPGSGVYHNQHHPWRKEQLSPKLPQETLWIKLSGNIGLWIRIPTTAPPATVRNGNPGQYEPLATAVACSNLAIFPTGNSEIISNARQARVGNQPWAVSLFFFFWPGLSTLADCAPCRHPLEAFYGLLCWFGKAFFMLAIYGRGCMGREIWNKQFFNTFYSSITLEFANNLFTLNL